MLKLLKFEFLRKKTVFLVAFVMLMLGEGYAIFKYYQMGEHVKYYIKEDIFGLFTMFLLLGLAILYLIDIITLLRQDIFKQEGYMLFLTPNSGYTILGAKVIFALIEGFVIAIIFVLMTILNARLMQIGFSSFDFNYKLNPKETLLLIQGLTIGVFGIVEFALTIFLSFALFKSIFSNVRFKGLLTFIIFVVVSFFKSQILNVVVNLVTKSMDYGMNYLSYEEGLSRMSMVMNISLVYVIIMSIALFIATGYLIENKINL